MGKLANVSGKEAVKAFSKAGWESLGRVGNHLVMISQVFEPTCPFLNTRSFL